MNQSQVIVIGTYVNGKVVPKIIVIIHTVFLATLSMHEIF